MRVSLASVHDAQIAVNLPYARELNLIKVGAALPFQSAQPAQFGRVCKMIRDSIMPSLAAVSADSKAWEKGREEEQEKEPKMKDLLQDATQRAIAYLEGLNTRAVAPSPEAVAGLTRLDSPMPIAPN